MNLYFQDACIKFLEYQKSELSLQTYDLVARNFRLHIIPYFENKKVCDIGIDDLLNWKTRVEEQGYTYGYNSSLYAKICQLYDFLIDFYDVRINLMRKVPKFKDNKVKNNKSDVWTFREFKRFIKQTKHDLIYNSFFHFLFFTGVRVSEACALRFDDIKGNYIIINKSLSKINVGGERINQPTKTKKIRKIRIDFKTKHKIINLYKYYSKYYPEINNNFYIFGGKKPLALTTIKRKKDYYCKLAKIKQIRIHDFRHSHATILYNKTKDAKLVQHRLGHQEIETTMNTYVHISENEEKRAIKALNLLNLNIF